MAAENDRKSERIFDDAGDGLINFSYELLTQTKLALVVPLSRFAPHQPLPPGGPAGGSSNPGHSIALMRNAQSKSRWLCHSFIAEGIL
jgi:hypothetical protein